MLIQNDSIQMILHELNRFETLSVTAAIRYQVFTSPPMAYQGIRHNPIHSIPSNPSHPYQWDFKESQPTNGISWIT
ncbi:hypothetical protein E2C01_043479 [Portunus trituberculatus]|uniref:Uncharacterized protein n=1 Tax=Portunus trituberculatus TaxID=210409 RepID=A0A5B7FWU2_PORTR|nr:hypothetical protein [Portunus trituberculatus]